MREPACCVEVRRRLVRHGLPADRIERIVRELAEHWEDVRAEVAAQGLPDKEAAARADARLGRPEQLAHDAIGGLQRGSWFGRHPFVTLGVLPLLLAPLLMAIVIVPLWGLDELVRFSDKGSAPATRNALFIVSGLWLVYGAALAAAPVWLCLKIWRAGLGFRWIAAACSCSALFALVRYFDADAATRTVSFALRAPWSLNLQTAAILLLHVFLAAGFLFAARKTAPVNCP